MLGIQENKASPLMAAACGFCAVIACISGFNQLQPTGLYTAVRPVSAVAATPVPISRGFSTRTNVASAAMVTAPSYDTVSSVSASVSPKVAGLCGAAAGFMALAVLLVRSKPQADRLPLATSIAMAATSGEKERPVWFPNAQAPAWLTGEYPGDRGFDPFSLAKDPADYAKYRDSEVFHGRWAMLGVVGCLVPELLAKFGGVPFAEPLWFKTGGAVFADGIDYLGNPELIHAKNASLILFTTLLFMGPVEAWRWNGSMSAEAKSAERTTYPGGPFDPLKLGSSPELKLKEIKNGRLAMTAMFGFWAQAYYTGEGPVANLGAHLANPFGANILSGNVAMFAASGVRSN